MKSLSLSQPHAIVMVGLPGSGKSSFATKFAETFNAPYVSLDTITDKCGCDRKTALALAEAQLSELLKTKVTIVVEAGAETRSERLALSKKLRSAGYQTLYVWVQTDPATAKQRFLKQTSQTEAEYDRRAKRFSQLHASEAPVVISGKHTYATQARVVLKRLSAPRANITKHLTPPIRTLSDVRRGK